MQIPPDVAQNAAELLKYGGQWFIDHLEAVPGDFVWNQGTKALVWTLFPKLTEVDPRELRRRIERLEAGTKGMDAQIRILRKERPDHDIESEPREPATQEFVVDSLAAMMESPSEEKREVLGRFVAERLYVETESPEELNLRQAESLTERMNRRHLYTLATLYLVHSTPLPQGVSRRQIHAWMEHRLLPIARVVADVDSIPRRVELPFVRWGCSLRRQPSIAAMPSRGNRTAAALVAFRQTVRTLREIPHVPGSCSQPVLCSTPARSSNSSSVNHFADASGRARAKTPYR
jgi:hypothetical protein